MVTSIRMAKRNKTNPTSTPIPAKSFPSSTQLVAEEEARASALLSDRQRAEAVLNQIRDDWWRVPGVVGVNVAYRTKYQQIISPLQIVIMVDVVAKQPRSVLTLQGRYTFPREILGVPVKVRQTRYLSSIARGIGLSQAIPPARRVQALIGGMAIAASDSPDTWGTLGVCLPDLAAPRPGSLVAITNYHVAGDSRSITASRATSLFDGDAHGKVDEKIAPSSVKPSSVDSASVESAWFDTVAFDKVAFGTVVRSAINRFVDASAIAAIDGGVSREFSEGILGLVPSHQPFRFLRQSELKQGGSIADISKSGARTGLLKGIITNRGMSIRVPELLDEPFDSVIEVSGLDDEIMTDAGDSGAVLVGRYQGEPVIFGLNFAMSDNRKRCYAIPFGRVIASLGLQLPSERMIDIP